MLLDEFGAVTAIRTNVDQRHTLQARECSGSHLLEEPCGACIRREGEAEFDKGGEGTEPWQKMKTGARKKQCFG